MGMKYFSREYSNCNMVGGDCDVEKAVVSAAHFPGCIALSSGVRMPEQQAWIRDGGL
jgi:hypothetical protein